MTQKVQGQAGISLADVYDVVGSIAGVEEIDVRSIKGVHDLGPQIHSERLNAFQLIADTGNVNQSTAWNVELGGFPDSINRLLSISVLTDTVARADFASIAIVDPDSGIDHIIWAWDSANDVESSVRWASPTVGTNFLLVSTRQILGVPTLIARTGAAWRMPTLNFRGSSAAFGAGTVRLRALMQIIRPDPGNPAPGHPSSFGLPIPGW